MMGEYEYDALQRDALGFILETEMWPVFLTWMRENVISDVGRKWLESSGAPDTLNKWRLEWARHSPDPAIRAAADLFSATGDLP